MSGDVADLQAARLTAFAVAGTITTAQEIVSTILREVESADPHLIAEETLTLVSIASARAIEAGGQGAGASLAATVVADLPFTYHDYLLGSVVLEADAPADATAGSVYERLARKRAFYSVHLAPGELPSGHVLKDKMELWMGRVSPPGLPEHPATRLARIDLVDMVRTHVRLVFEFARKEASSRTTPS